MDWAEVFTSTDAQAEFEMLETTWECTWLPETSTMLITLPGSGQLCRATVAAAVSNYPAQKPRIDVHACRNLGDGQVRAILSAAQTGAAEALDTAFRGRALHLRSVPGYPELSVLLHHRQPGCRSLDLPF